MSVPKKESKRGPMGEYIVPPGEKPLTSLGDCMPGPADYDPKIDPTKQGSPHYSLVGRPKLTDDKKFIPGPFEYNTSGDALWKKKITLKGRGKCYFDIDAEKVKSVLYKVEYKAIGNEGPKYKIGMRAPSNIYTGPANSLVQPVDTKGFCTPGPNYRPNSSYWGRGPKKSFGARFKEQTPEGPGPGDYDVNTSNRGPSHTFGIKLPEPVGVQQTVNKFSPAPNTYDLGTTIGKAPAVSIVGRTAASEKVRTGPCPSQYSPAYTKSKHSQRGKTLGYKWFDVDEPPTPGPAYYYVKHVNLMKNPEFTCRQRVKASYPDSVTYAKEPDKYPGPGAYETQDTLENNERPAFSFRQRLEPPVDKEKFPGPNAYLVETKEKPGSKRTPSFSMGKRLAAPNCMKDTPGPGEYTPKHINHVTEKGKYTMTSRTKAKTTYVNPVAPNMYTLPELMAAKNKGVILKSRASPYVYSGFRTNKIEEQRSLPLIAN
ncbi:sperm-tail PG-rich repeat-containing protein 2-like isoform X2 [Dreissena polymorpha]|uniref:sperm-tail PG-rich repeat-containing protein 2-like isoform X2 n=1 Tax=Dreissena polymorpha TaxID=45954 RepID=UPI0022645841|nr:sperm-tail PG-rich repeat-containing protein 2-like isoform X2 [Dreissena polymorpha]